MSLSRRTYMYGLKAICAAQTRENLMLSKRHESSEVDHRTWQHVPSGTLGPPAVTLIKYLKFIERLLQRCMHHFKSDVIKIWTICAFRVLNPRQ